MTCIWCGDEGCGVCNEEIAEQNREKWRKEGTLVKCSGCGEEFDHLFLILNTCEKCWGESVAGSEEGSPL